MASGSVPLWEKAEIASYIKGRQDLTIFFRVNDDYCLTLPLELKSARGKMSDAQLLNQERVGTKVAFSFEEATLIIEAFMKYAYSLRTKIGIERSLVSEGGIPNQACNGQIKSDLASGEK
jgi:hypothetical protein